MQPLPRPGSLVVGTLFKYHAACYLTHSSIEAIKLLRRQLAFNGPDVASIDLHVAPGHLSVCNIPSPRSGLETKFSLRHTAALAACGKDTAAIETYSDENARDATLVAVRERVTVHGDRTAGRDAQVMIRTGGGQTAEATSMSRSRTGIWTARASASPPSFTASPIQSLVPNAPPRSSATSRGWTRITTSTC